MCYIYLASIVYVISHITICFELLKLFFEAF